MSEGMGTDNRDRRRFLRVPFQAEVTIKSLPDGTKMEADGSRDISMKGIYCYVSKPFPTGTPCTVELKLTGTSSALWLRIEGRVVRTDQEGMAILFESMDLDAFIHLKNILYYNSGDPERIDKELLLSNNTFMENNNET